MANKGFPPERYTDKSITQAVKSYLAEQFNDIVNVFVGDAKQNQERGGRMAEAKDSMEQALAQDNMSEFHKAYNRYAKAAFDPEPIAFFLDTFSSIRKRRRKAALGK